MELELGLALPYQTPMMENGLDLNSCSNEMEIETRKTRYRRRGSSSVDDGEEVDSKILPLLLWSGQRQPHDDDDDDAPKWRSLHVEDDQENEEEDEEIIGWPTISSLRKELLHHRHDGGGAADRVVAPVRNYLYVKVKMEGVAIGRKIDLRLHNSYHSLTDSLINMFAKYIRRSNENYTILYQDRDGDWMVAGDVPWERFVESVQRMEIVRSGN